MSSDSVLFPKYLPLNRELVLLGRTLGDSGEQTHISQSAAGSGQSARLRAQCPLPGHFLLYSPSGDLAVWGVLPKLSMPTLGLPPHAAGSLERMAVYTAGN